MVKKALIRRKDYFSVIWIWKLKEISKMLSVGLYGTMGRTNMGRDIPKCGYGENRKNKMDQYS